MRDIILNFLCRDDGAEDSFVLQVAQMLIAVIVIRTCIAQIYLILRKYSNIAQVITADPTTIRINIAYLLRNTRESGCCDAYHKALEPVVVFQTESCNIAKHEFVRKRSVYSLLSALMILAMLPKHGCLLVFANFLIVAIIF